MEAWLADMTNEERNEFVDAVFDLMMAEDTSNVKDILKPQNIKDFITAYGLIIGDTASNTEVSWV